MTEKTARNVMFVLGAIFGIGLCILFSEAQAQEISGTVIVVDADTLDVDGTRVRIWGIDAPEVATEAGTAAKAWAVRVWAGEAITCRQKSRKLSYGRTVAQCFRYIQGRGLSDLAFEAINAGHAVDVPKYSGGYYGR